MKRALLSLVFVLAMVPAARAEPPWIPPPPPGVSATSPTISTPTITGTLGTTAGGGTGMMGVGTGPTPGVSLNVYTGNSNYFNGAETWAVGGIAHNNPTGVCTPTPSCNTNLFGAVLNSTWGGSVDSSASGSYNEGAQNEAFVVNSAKLNASYGTESAVVTTGSATPLHAWASYNHIDNEGTATIPDAVDYFAGNSNVGGGSITVAKGLYVAALNGGTTYGIYMDNQTSGAPGGTTNYAIFTGLGTVRFGDALIAPNATIPIQYGTVRFGDGVTSPSTITLVGQTGQGADFLDIGSSGSLVAFDNAGDISMNATNRSFSYGSTTAIFGAGQALDLSAGEINLNSTGFMSWSIDSHSYDTRDLGLCRSAASTLSVANNGSSCGATGALAAGSITAAGNITVGGHDETTGSTPALTSGWGSGATISGNDNVGQITAGSSPGAAPVMTFATAWTNAPICVFKNNTSGGGAVASVSTTTAAMTGASGFTPSGSVVYQYRCSGWH